MSPPTHPPAPRGPLRALHPLAALALGITLAGLPWIRPSQRQADSPAEVRLSDLMRQENRLFLIAQSTPFTGTVVERYDDGNLKSRSSVSNGLLHGLSEGYHPNGFIEVQERFHAGRSHGARIKWQANGTKLSEAEIVDGALHGTFRRWHENGQLAEEIVLRNGRPSGPSRAYYPSGQLKAQATLDNGRLLTRSYFPESKRDAELSGRSTVQP